MVKYLYLNRLRQYLKQNRIKLFIDVLSTGYLLGVLHRRQHGFRVIVISKLLCFCVCASIKHGALPKTSFDKNQYNGYFICRHYCSTFRLSFHQRIAILYSKCVMDQVVFTSSLSSF